MKNLKNKKQNKKKSQRKGNNNTGIKRNSIDAAIDKAFPEKAQEKEHPLWSNNINAIHEISEEEYKLLERSNKEEKKAIENLVKDENYSDQRNIGKLHIIGEKDEETSKFQKAVDNSNAYVNFLLDEAKKIRESKQPLSFFDKIKNKLKEWFGQ